MNEQLIIVETDNLFIEIPQLDIQLPILELEELPELDFSQIK